MSGEIRLSIEGFIGSYHLSTTSGTITVSGERVQPLDIEEDVDDRADDDVVSGERQVYKGTVEAPPGIVGINDVLSVKSISGDIFIEFRD